MTLFTIAKLKTCTWACKINNSHQCKCSCA